jgi:hypothetical protein
MNDSELLAAFEDCTLPFEQWTHRAHVRIAYLFVSNHSFEVALKLVGAGIRKYNAAHKVPEGPDRGYNETTTHAFLHLVAATAAAYGQTHRVSDSEGFCDMHPQLMNKHALRLFYSPQRRMDPRAKATFVEPDLTALPRIVQR